MSSKNIEEKIEAYLLRKMSVEEKFSFEEELKYNNVLSKQVEEQREVHQMMEVLVEDDLLERMRQWDVEDENVETKTEKQIIEKEEVLDIKNKAFEEKDNREYLRGIIARDSLILKKIYSNYAPKISTFIISRGGTKEDAIDVFQEALLIIHKKTKEQNFQLRSPFEHFLKGICRNIWLSKLRSRHSKNIPLDVLDEEYSDIHKRTEQQQQQIDLLWSTIAKLPEKYQTLLRLRLIERKTFEEIAKEMSYANINSARLAFHRCKQKLTTLVKNDSRYEDGEKI